MYRVVTLPTCACGVSNIHLKPWPTECKFKLLFYADLTDAIIAIIYIVQKGLTILCTFRGKQNGSFDEGSQIADSYYQVAYFAMRASLREWRLHDSRD